MESSYNVKKSHVSFKAKKGAPQHKVPPGGGSAAGHFNPMTRQPKAWSTQGGTKK